MDDELVEAGGGGETNAWEKCAAGGNVRVINEVEHTQFPIRTAPPQSERGAGQGGVHRWGLLACLVASQQSNNEPALRICGHGDGIMQVLQPRGHAAELSIQPCLRAQQVSCRRHRRSCRH